MTIVIRLPLWRLYNSLGQVLVSYIDVGDRKMKVRSLQFEGLGSRRLLAGNVSAQVDQSGALKFFGDGLSNGVSVRIEGKTLVARGSNLDGAPTLINGRDSWSVDVNRVNSVFAEMGNGADVFEFFGPASPRQFSSFDVNSGAGFDTVDVQNIAATNVTLNGGTGDDTLKIGLCSGGKLTVVGGEGNNKVFVSNAAVREVGISTGNQNDMISVSESRLDKLVVRAGAGRDELSLTGLVGLSKQRVADIDCQLQADDDRVSVSRVAADRFIGRGGNGQNTITISGSSIINLQLTNFNFG